MTCWNDLIEKIEKRLQSWKGKLLSLGGQVTLLNSVISAIPLYWLSLYRMPVGVRYRIDKLRRRFLWFGGSTVRKRYSLISWTRVCRSKDLGGLGVLDLKVMNDALLAKWLMRFLDDNVVGNWKYILIHKYSVIGTYGIHSPFWKDIMKSKNIIDVSTDWQVGNGHSIRFWLDRWAGNSALATVYPNLFDIACDKQILVSQVFSPAGLHIDFCRQLVSTYHTEWCTLLTQFQNFQLGTINDHIVWRWSSTGRFSVHSLYTWLIFGGIPNSTFTKIWKAHIPLKIRIFLWLAKQNRILTRDNLSKRGWQGDQSCIFCHEQETVSHLFLTCSMVSQIWHWIARYNNFVFTCVSLDDLWDIGTCIPMKDDNLVMMIIGAVLWTVWLERNRLIFKGGVAKGPHTLGTQIIAFVKFWCSLQKYEAIEKLIYILPPDAKDLLGGLLATHMEDTRAIIPILGTGSRMEDEATDGG